MKNLHFDYEMQIDYSVAVARCNYTIKCFPKNTMRQKVMGQQITLDPVTKYSWGTDGLRNQQIYGLNEEEHKTFRFRIEGNVQTGLSEYEEPEEEDIAMIFRHPHGLNRAGEKIKEYFGRQELEGKNTREIAEALMHCLHRDFQYKPCTTDVQTSAEEAFAQGTGVCQDYAHIFIALLHLAGISARYVTGLIVGEGASHAWVEILDDGKWYGFDPTNDTAVGDEHIKIGIGRDAKDCMINRGIMHGGGLHTQTIRVQVKEV